MECDDLDEWSRGICNRFAYLLDVINRRAYQLECLLEKGTVSDHIETNSRYATQMIEIYAVLVDDKTDKILALVAKAEKNGW